MWELQLCLIDEEAGSAGGGDLSKVTRLLAPKPRPSRDLETVICATFQREAVSEADTAPLRDDFS